MQLGATHFLCTTSTQTLLVLVNGKHVDPRILIQDTASDDIITFRVCPLPGGCAFHDTIDLTDYIVGIQHPITRALHVVAGAGHDTLEKIVQRFSFTASFDLPSALSSRTLNLLEQHFEVSIKGVPIHFFVIRKSDCSASASVKSMVCIQGPFENKPQNSLVCQNECVGLWILKQLPPMPRELQFVILQNGAIVPPAVPFCQCDSEVPIRCRVGKLPGGAKKNEVKIKLKQCLKDHGVPEDKISDRVEAVIGGVGIENIRGFENTDDEQFWQHLKKAASESRVRLVTPSELKEYQRTKRSQQRADNSNEPKSKKPNKKTGFEVPPIDSLRFDATHFTAGDEIVPFLPSTKFGPDAKGLVIMSVEQALLHAKEECLSFEPLAILAIGHDAERVGTKLLIPAHTADATPVLVPGALVQYGEEVVEFNANIPSICAETIDTVTLEFTLHRKHLSHWESTANPLYYLGLQCPELRGTGRTLSSWSVKSYKDRKPVNFSIATT